MKRAILFTLKSCLFPVLLVVSGSGLVAAQTPHDVIESAAFRKTLLENHIKPPATGNDFSNGIVERVLEDLDPENIYFTNEDIAPLSSFRTRAGDDWLSGKNEFPEALVPVFTRALQRAHNIAVSKAHDKIDWNSHDQFVREGNAARAADDIKLKERWNVWIKYNVLNNLADRLDRDSVKAPVNLAFLTQHGDVEKMRLLNAETRNILQLQETAAVTRQRVMNVYLKAIASSFDPHTVYLPPVELENFIGALSSQEFSFGMQLRENADGDVIIERLVPGGPAWKSGKLHRNDILATMKWEDNSEILLEGIGIGELSRLLGSDNHRAIYLTVQKPNGEKTTVFMRKEKIEDDNIIVKGFVLQGKEKVGYISLPGFYSNWGTDGGPSCANDVARQILKMKKENIDGLILDIRSNGGGSVSEAIELAGIFIDEGPLAVFKNKNGILTTLKDVNRGTIYDGPLVIMIDGRSASASEMVAAALQDYQRAIIAGSTSFGKATGQRIFSLDPASHEIKMDPSKNPEFGYLTVTIEKIYRVTGKSVQGKGVIPDIHIPDVYEKFEQHEEELPNALSNDSVTVKVPVKRPGALPVATLRELSDRRITNNKWFRLVTETSNYLTARIPVNNSAVELKWEDFLSQPFAGTLQNDSLHRMPFQNITVPQFDRMQLTRNPYYIENNNYWISNLKRDEYVAEAYMLIEDYIHTKK